MAKNSVLARLSAARADMSFEKQSGGLKYPFLNADDVLQMVGDALVKHGVLFVPSMINVDITWYEKNTKPVQHALATFEISFFDIETGDELKLMTHGSAEDYSDKALGKAQSYAIKHLFSRMFLKGEDNSINDEEDMSTSGAKTPMLDKHFGPKNQRSNETTPGDMVMVTADTWASVKRRLEDAKLSSSTHETFPRLAKIVKKELGEGNTIELITARRWSELDVIKKFEARIAEKANEG